MEDRSTCAVLVLERPTGALEHTVRATECDVATRESAVASSETGVPDATDEIESVLRAPGLAVLVSLFLVEGYRWLGVFHTGGSAGGTLLFGSIGLALVALLAPLAALVLLSDRRAPGMIVVEDLVIASAVLVAAATGTALVVGGPRSGGRRPVRATSSWPRRGSPP